MKTIYNKTGQTKLNTIDTDRQQRFQLYHGYMLTNMNIWQVIGGVILWRAATVKKSEYSPIASELAQKNWHSK